MKKRIMAGLLATSIIIFPVGASAAYVDLAGEQEVTQVKPIMEIIPIKADLHKSFYRGATGKVTAIEDYGAVTGSKIISLENIATSAAPGEDPGESKIIISPNTFVLDNAEIKVGNIITGFYDASRPMLMIYPPQYNCEVVAVESDEYNVKFDIFNQELVSMDNALKLLINEETNIVTLGGKAVTGELADRKLIVLYSVTTRSIPAQTHPLKIIALPTTGEKDIVVNNKVITAPRAYDYAQGVIMVPLRAIAEALGYEVNWNGEGGTVSIGEKVSLKIGEEIVTLGIAPSLHEGSTYVPLHFFTGVMGVDQAAECTEQIVINNNLK